MLNYASETPKKQQGMGQNIDISKLTTFIFDLGGVIVNLDRNACVRAYEKLGIANANDLLDNFKPNGIFLKLEKGEITAEEFRNSIRTIAQKEITDQEINDAHAEFLLGIPQKRKDALLQLRSNFRVLGLSNTSPIHLHCHILPMLTDSTHTPDDYFELIHTSFELKSVKPEAEIFNRMIKISHLNPEECLFFDDGLANIETARKLGFQIFHVNDDNDWVEWLKSVL